MSTMPKSRDPDLRKCLCVLIIKKKNIYIYIYIYIIGKTSYRQPVNEMVFVKHTPFDYFLKRLHGSLPQPYRLV